MEEECKQAGRDEIIGKRLVCARKQNGQIHGEPLEYCHKCVSNTDFLYEKIAALEKENAELKSQLEGESRYQG